MKESSDDDKDIPRHDFIGYIQICDKYGSLPEILDCYSPIVPFFVSLVVGTARLSCGIDLLGNVALG